MSPAPRSHCDVPSLPTQTKAASGFAPENLEYRLALGIAQHHPGRFQKERYSEALATVGKCDKNVRATLAFQATAQHHMEAIDDAAVSLDRLRQAMKVERWMSDAEALSFLAEAEALMHSAPRKPGQ